MQKKKKNYALSKDFFRMFFFDVTPCTVIIQKRDVHYNKSILRWYYVQVRIYLLYDYVATCYTNIFSDVNGSYYILRFWNMIHLPRHALMNDIAYLWYVHLVFISSVLFWKKSWIIYEHEKRRKISVYDFFFSSAYSHHVCAYFEFEVQNVR